MTSSASSRSTVCVPLPGRRRNATRSVLYPSASLQGEGTIAGRRRTRLWKEGAPMRRFSVAVGLALFLALGVVACGGSSGSAGGGGSTISLGASSFSGNTSVTIKAGEAVTFDDSSGGTHMLVTGTNGQFTAATGAPSELSSATGLPLQAGDTKTVTFATAGTYQITCTIHPSMQATITVTS